MNFVLRHLGSSNPEIELPKGKSVMIGYDERSCFRLASYYRTNDLTVQVWHSGDGCLAENLTRNQRYVQLNGNPLTTVALLASGDVLQIGLDQIEISTRVPAPVVAVNSGQSAAEPVPIDFSLRSQFANPATAVYVPVDQRWCQAMVLEHVAKKMESIVLANFRTAEETPANLEKFGEDLLKNAPVEVTSIYSLHAIHKAPPEEKLNLLKQLWAKDAVIAIIPEQDPKDCLKAINLFLGWFAKPGVLEMTLTHGSRQLCESIMKPVKAVVFKPKSSPSEWAVCCKPALAENGLSEILH